jgi:DNA repair exonuclease SbcCD ATPase subunit
MKKGVDYCGEKYKFLFDDVQYYHFGFKERHIWICKKCQEDKWKYRRLSFKDRKWKDKRLFLTTSIVSLDSAYLEIRDTIKEKSNREGVINYFDAVKEAYEKNGALAQDMFKRDLKMEDIGKNLKYLWKFTFHIVNNESKIKGVDNNPDNFLVTWVD